MNQKSEDLLQVYKTLTCLHESDHPGDQSGLVHPPDEHRRRPVPGQGSAGWPASAGCCRSSTGRSFGLFDVDLAPWQPDFYSGSAHKWPCGPNENGVLYINKGAQPKIWATLLSAYPGRVGVSKTFEGFGQRDEPAMIAFGEALDFQNKIGRAHIERRSRELTSADRRAEEIDGVKIWTSPDPSRARRCCRSSPARSTCASCRRRCIRKTGSDAPRAAARIVPASVCRRISTTPS